MQSAELRELTASEELSLEEEYAMQRESSTFNPPSGDSDLPVHQNAD
jgi:hypothetical protein